MTDTPSAPDLEPPRSNPAPDHDCEVDTLNLMWLLGARELARSDAEKAVLVYGLDPEVLDICVMHRSRCCANWPLRACCCFDRASACAGCRNAFGPPGRPHSGWGCR